MRSPSRRALKSAARRLPRATTGRPTSPTDGVSCTRAAWWRTWLHHPRRSADLCFHRPSRHPPLRRIRTGYPLSGALRCRVAHRFSLEVHVEGTQDNWPVRRLSNLPLTRSIEKAVPSRSVAVMDGGVAACAESRAPASRTAPGHSADRRRGSRGDRTSTALFMRLAGRSRVRILTASHLGHSDAAVRVTDCAVIVERARRFLSQTYIPVAARPAVATPSRQTRTR